MAENDVSLLGLALCTAIAQPACMKPTRKLLSINLEVLKELTADQRPLVNGGCLSDGSPPGVPNSGRNISSAGASTSL